MTKGKGGGKRRQRGVWNMHSDLDMLTRSTSLND